MLAWVEFSLSKDYLFHVVIVPYPPCIWQSSLYFLMEYIPQAKARVLWLRCPVHWGVLLSATGKLGSILEFSGPGVPDF